ncbi:hypothetical protein CR513_10368, partial [Mucuna pruriens]
MWNMHLGGAPNKHVPHFAENRVREHRMCWSDRWRIPVQDTKHHHSTSNRNNKCLKIILLQWKIR